MPEQQPSKNKERNGSKLLYMALLEPSPMSGIQIVPNLEILCLELLPHSPFETLPSSPASLSAAQNREALCKGQRKKINKSIRSPLLSTLLCCLSFQVTLSLLLLLRSWKNDFIASYVDQQMAAAGVWNSILGTHPLISPPYPSFFSIVRITSPIDPLLNLSHPHTPCAFVNVNRV